MSKISDQNLDPDSPKVCKGLQNQKMPKTASKQAPRAQTAFIRTRRGEIDPCASFWAFHPKSKNGIFCQKLDFFFQQFGFLFRQIGFLRQKSIFLSKIGFSWQKMDFSVKNWVFPSKNFVSIRADRFSIVKTQCFWKKLPQKSANRWSDRASSKNSPQWSHVYEDRFVKNG